MSPTLKGVSFALLGFALYSTHDAVIKSLGASYAPFQIVFFSVLLGFPLANVMLMRDQTEATLRPVHPYWTLARTVLTIITGASAFYAFSTLPMSQVYAILFAAPLLITVLSIPILGERVGAHRWAAVVVGLIGVLVVVRPGVTELSLGHLTAMVAAVCSAAASVIVRRIGREERTLVLMLYPMMGNVLAMGAFLPFVYEPMPALHFGGFAAIAALGFIAGLCIIAAYRNADAAMVAPMQYSQIVWSVVFGLLIFDELPDRFTMIGAGIIIASGLYIVLREARGSVSRNTPVLRTRTRLDTGSNVRVSSALRDKGPAS